MGLIFPQQLEKLAFLPIKHRGGLGQRRETWNQAPEDHIDEICRSTKVPDKEPPHKGSP